MRKTIISLCLLGLCGLFAQAAPAGTYRDISGDGMIEISPNGKAIFMWVGGYSVGGMTIIEEEDLGDGRVEFTVRDGDTVYNNCYYWITSDGDVMMKIANRTFKMSGGDTNRSELKERLKRGW